MHCSPSVTAYLIISYNYWSLHCLTPCMIMHYKTSLYISQYFLAGLAILNLNYIQILVTQFQICYVKAIEMIFELTKCVHFMRNDNYPRQTFLNYLEKILHELALIWSFLLVHKGNSYRANVGRSCWLYITSNKIRNVTLQARTN